MKKPLESVFVVCLLLFLLSGALLVVGQLIGLIFQKGEMILFFQNVFSKPAFILSAIAGVIAYILNIVNKKATVDEKNSDKNNQLNNPA